MECKRFGKFYKVQTYKKTLAFEEKKRFVTSISSNLFKVKLDFTFSEVALLKTTSSFIFFSD